MREHASLTRYNLQYEACITYPKSKPRMFGQPLEKIMGLDGSRGYPIIVLECVELIRDRGKSTGSEWLQ